MRSGAYRLCVVAHSTQLGGAERFLQFLLGALPPTVHVTVLGADPRVLADVVARRPGAAAVAVPMRVRPLRAALRRARPDVVHVNLPDAVDCRPAILAAATLRLPFVLVDHLPAPGLTWRGRAVQRLTTRASARRVAVGTAAARAVERFCGLRPGSVRTIPNGVPPHPGPAHEQRDPPLLGVLARLERQKGVDVLLHALVQAPGLGLTVAGDGSERAALEKLAARLGVGDRVRFSGWAPAPESFLATVDVLVAPSRNEAMPLVVLEAMHAGLPVLATRVGAVGEVVQHGRTGLLVEPEDVGGLASALRELAADRELRARLGAAGRERARTAFSDTAMAAAYDRAYREVIAGRR
ncbi:glycosyltransferase family 4 protein [Motilibacter aurantiacus]|uniref:glycosyltransferase family 4 protein n=1 Tax=Motilibacter aurantiacus TaxID=2714955 RepID=UPI0014093CE6|nr:glycosyltransferase family 4 protein [Motilibacter aurantiacus]NHC45253.1 glycosyltransferase family 4 protein [Motilibacter aurantiacus]